MKLLRGGTTSTKTGRYRYGVLDDFGEVLRWQDHQPLNHKYIKEKIPRQTDWEFAKALAETIGYAPF